MVHHGAKSLVFSKDKFVSDSVSHSPHEDIRVTEVTLSGAQTQNAFCGSSLAFMLRSNSSLSLMYRKVLFARVTACPLL